MSNNNVEWIEFVNLQYSRYVPIPIVLLGFVGNLFNIVIFTRRPMNTNPCSIYFLSSSAVNLSVLIFGSIFRCLADGFHFDVVAMHLAFCRLRYYILHCSMVLSPWIVVLAGFDRYCVSSPNIYRRRLSTRRNARHNVFFSTILCSLLFSHVLKYFTIEQLPSGALCYAQSGVYRVFYDILYFTTYSVIPPILMIIVGLGTLHNLHQTRLQVRPQHCHRKHPLELRKKDRQLIRMLLMQFLVVLFCTLPIAIQKLYLTFTQDVWKSDYRLAVEAFVVQITRQLAFANSSLSFYVFTLSGSLFRRETARVIASLFGTIFGRKSCLYRRYRRILGRRENPPSPSIEKRCGINNYRYSKEVDV